MRRNSGVCALRALFVALAVSCAPAAGQPAEWSLHWSPDTLTVEFELVRALDDTLSPGEPLMRPLAVRTIAGHVYVSDIGADGVAEIDSTGAVIRWIAGQGKGPGELYGVGRMAANDSQLIVGEALNGRVSEFTSDGRFVRTYSAPFAAGALALGPTGALATGRSTSHFANALRPNGDPHNALRRPPEPSSVRFSRWRRLPGHDLIEADTARTWVFDQASGALCRYASVSARPSCALLPDALLDRLLRYRDERVDALETAMRLRVNAAPLAKDLVRIGPLLALLLALPDLPIVLIDVDDGSVTPVVVHSDSMPVWARTARGFAWDGSRFVAVGDEGVGRMYLARRAHTH